MSAEKPAPSLAELRQEIDRIDEAMHRLLMERGTIIDRLIASKKASKTGIASAFRPGREASMMKALAERHDGLLPLDTVEGIWRVIIGTFTYVQSNYSVHADISGGDAPMRDSARFHFGFTVPYMTHPSAAAVIEAVASSGGDLGIFRLDQGATSGAWWRTLADRDRPKVIARLPFIERPDHPAGTPVFVISKPLVDAAVRDVVLYAAQFERWHRGANEALVRLGGEVVASAADAHGLSELIAVPGHVEPAQLHETLTKAGASLAQLAEVGSHAERFHVK
ncbi:chorismate mutase [Microvirga terrestris]|uniref:chorismate mutase n=1 Tax=Microvirga terrestris TaxID=2791024 RepID=A0ABS0HRE7_9HYPH|nr:chorismate mutase [Microvirga terrestris]MBF9196061.1 chorismate mutase [Microvirga terrestris]